MGGPRLDSVVNWGLQGESEDRGVNAPTAGVDGAEGHPKGCCPPPSCPPSLDTSRNKDALWPGLAARQRHSLRVS